METNEVLAQLPPHLMQFVIDQPYNAYTWQDQAVWRYVMRQNAFHLQKVAHETYIEGLKQAGIEVDRIPNMYGMNRILEKIGWAAAAVDGFIPPGAFMEFQAYKVLVIAADIRTIDHIEYTPAPDIIHESAGHAPIIANLEYAQYLVDFGSVGSKAFSSKNDYELYEAIRHLSIIKEDPGTSLKEINQAENVIAEIQNAMGEPSEMALCRNLHWWTVEYGLVGTIDKYKLYGAGLLSSIGESKSCLDPKIKKIVYSIHAKYCNYDITKPQPQLFVTPDFTHLSEVLEEFAQSLSWKRGGLEGILKAIDTQNTSTCVFSSGLAVSGTFVDVLTNKINQPIFIQTKGPTAIAYEGKQLPNLSKKHHPSGYCAPIGKLKDSRKSIESFSKSELKEYGILEGENVSLVFESGVKVKGFLQKIWQNSLGQIMLLELSSCLITLEGQTLFKSEDKYVMAIGEKIISAFSGAADVRSFEPIIDVPKEKTHKITYNDKALALHSLYLKVRDCRESKTNLESLGSIFDTLKKEYPKDWLLALEILEIIAPNVQFFSLTQQIKNYLEDKKTQNAELKKLIENGLHLLEK